MQSIDATFTVKENPEVSPPLERLTTTLVFPRVSEGHRSQSRITGRRGHGLHQVLFLIDITQATCVL